jgi:hypothetical protein
MICILFGKSNSFSFAKGESQLVSGFNPSGQESTHLYKTGHQQCKAVLHTGITNTAGFYITVNTSSVCWQADKLCAYIFNGPSYPVPPDCFLPNFIKFSFLLYLTNFNIIPVLGILAIKLLLQLWGWEKTELWKGINWDRKIGNIENFWIFTLESWWDCLYIIFMVFTPVWQLIIKVGVNLGYCSDFGSTRVWTPDN